MKQQFKLMKLLFVLAFVIPFVGCQTQTEWNITDYGAKADETVNTQAIQKAIDACSMSGGGTVVIKDGRYISGTLLLKDNVTLHVAKDAILFASDNPNDFYSIDPFIDATGQYRGQCFIGAENVSNIAITGEGTIDGNGKLFTPGNVKKTIKRLGITLEQPDVTGLIAKGSKYVNNKIRFSNRPFLVRFSHVENVKVKNVTLRQSAAWCMHIFQCNNFEVDGITIYNKANRNNDGIDIDSSTNGVIKNSLINSDDDAICFKSTSPKPSENVEVYNCRLSSGWGAIKFGTESMGGYKNITIKDCKIFDTRGGGIKILSVDGAVIDNVLIDGIEMVDVEMPIFMRLGERLLTYRQAEQQPVGSINNVTISNVTAVSRKKENLRLFPTVGFFFTGTPNHKIGKITLENIDITLPGGGTDEDAKIVVPENITEYPEFTKLGATPAHGIFARHIENMSTKNIKITTLSEDQRDEIVLIDVNGI